MSRDKALFILLGAFLFASCESQIVESDVEGTPKVTLRIVNAVVGAGTLVYSYPADPIPNISTRTSDRSGFRARRYVFD